MAVIRKLLPLFVMAAWSAGFAFLLYDDNYLRFLKPEFSVLVWISLAASLVLGASLFSGVLSGTLPEQKTPWVKGIILVLPLGFIIASGQSTLGSYALTKRPMTGLPANAAVNTAPPEPKAQETISIASLIREFQTFEGKSVQVEGLLAASVVNHDELSAVFRYFITCCAADAQPVGVFLDRVEGLKDNDWVRVKGRVEMKSMDGFQVIFMDLEKITSVPKPSKNAAYIYN